MTHLIQDGKKRLPVPIEKFMEPITKGAFKMRLLSTQFKSGGVMDLLSFKEELERRKQNAAMKVRIYTELQKGLPKREIQGVFDIFLQKIEEGEETFVWSFENVKNLYIYFSKESKKILEKITPLDGNGKPINGYWKNKEEEIKAMEEEMKGWEVKFKSISYDKYNEAYHGHRLAKPGDNS